MIIVEGCDNSGKTTLIQRLAEDLKLLSIVNRKKPQNRRDVYHYTASMIYLSFHFSTIFDRWQAISEPIYGPICQRQMILEPEDLEDLHRSTALAKPLVIYCRPKDSTILSFGDRAQMEGVIENARRLITDYDNEMEHLARHFPILRYDYEHDTYESLREQVLTHLKGPIQ